MKRHFTELLVLAIAAVLCVPPVFAQVMGTVKGVCRDMNGNPIAGATVEWQNTENGRKYALKTNKKGEYFSLGIEPGKYKVTLSQDGKQLDSVNNFPVQTDEATLDFDLKKSQVEAAKQKRSRFGVQLTVVERKPQSEERQRVVRLEPLGRLERVDGHRHIADLHQRDTKQVVILRDTGAQARQPLETDDRGERCVRSERNLSEGAQHVLGVRCDRPRFTERFESTGRVAPARLQPRKLQQRLHRLKPIPRRAQQPFGVLDTAGVQPFRGERERALSIGGQRRRQRERSAAPTPTPGRARRCRRFA